MAEDAEGNYVPDWAAKDSSGSKGVSARNWARRIKKRETNGGGLALQIVGLLFTLTLYGAILGIPLIIAGEMMSKKWRCSKCGNLLSGKEVLMCPTCHAELED